MTYSFGDPCNPLLTDPRFDTAAAAEIAALEALDPDILAVRDDESSECLALVWEGTMYRAWRPPSPCPLSAGRCDSVGRVS